MVERTTVKETETSGEYGEQVIAHGKTSGGVYKPIYIKDDGSVKIDPAPPDVNAIADQVWDELLADHVTEGSMGKKLNDIPTTPMRGTDDAFLAVDGANLPDDADIGDLPWDEAQADHVAAGSFGLQISDIKGYVDEVEDLLKNATYGLSALNTKILNIVNKDATPVVEAYPYAAGNVTVTSSALSWHWGDWAEVIPANTITETFWIVGLHLLNMYVGTNTMLLEVGIGASGSEVTKGDLPHTHYQRTDAGYIEGVSLVFPIPIKVAANTRVAARITDNLDAAQNYSVKVVYATGL